MLLIPVALLNYLDRQMLATMKSSMVGDIPGIENMAQWGLVLGSFKWVYDLQPYRRLSRRPGQSTPRHLLQPLCVVGDHVGDWTCPKLRTAPLDARHHGRQ
jgi:hypothetical protein